MKKPENIKELLQYIREAKVNIGPDQEDAPAFFLSDGQPVPQEDMAARMNEAQAYAQKAREEISRFRVPDGDVLFAYIRQLPRENKIRDLLEAGKNNADLLLHDSMPGEEACAELARKLGRMDENVLRGMADDELNAVYDQTLRVAALTAFCDCLDGKSRQIDYFSDIPLVIDSPQDQAEQGKDQLLSACIITGLSYNSRLSGGLEGMGPDKLVTLVCMLEETELVMHEIASGGKTGLSAVKAGAGLLAGVGLMASMIPLFDVAEGIYMTSELLGVGAIAGVTGIGAIGFAVALLSFEILKDCLFPAGIGNTRIGIACRKAVFNLRSHASIGRTSLLYDQGAVLQGPGRAAVREVQLLRARSV